jgi:hypothetical protein
MTTINRLGGQTQQHRPITPYEKGQMITHYPTVGRYEMARRLHRTPDSIRHLWDTIKHELQQASAA